MSIMSDFKYEEPDAESAWILMQIADSGGANTLIHTIHLWSPIKLLCYFNGSDFV